MEPRDPLFVLAIIRHFWGFRSDEEILERLREQVTEELDLIYGNDPNTLEERQCQEKDRLIEFIRTHTELALTSDEDPSGYLQYITNSDYTPDDEIKELLIESSKKLKSSIIPVAIWSVGFCPEIYKEDPQKPVRYELLLEYSP